LSLSTSLFPSPPPLRNLPSFPTRRSSDLQKIQGRPFTVVGDGTQTRDFVFVTDVARAFLLAAESAVSGQVFNVGAGNPQRINRLDRKSTRLNSSHVSISYAVFCLKKKKKK